MYTAVALGRGLPNTTCTFRLLAQTGATLQLKQENKGIMNVWIVIMSLCHYTVFISIPLTITDVKPGLVKAYISTTP
jgi:hypothetical protein